MKILSLRTKVEAVLIVAFLLAVGLSSVFAVTRTISDTGDTVETFIRNSKGNYWTATGANIQTAIWDLNSTGGTVWIPVGTFYFTVGLNIINNTNLIGTGVKTILKAGSGYADPSSYGIIKGYDTKRIHNVTIRDLLIDGNGSAQTVTIGKAKDITFTHLTLRNAHTHGIQLRNNCSKIIIDDVKILNITTYQAIGAAYLTDSIINNVIIKNGTGAGNQGLDPDNSKNITISNIIIDNVTLGAKFVYCENININNVVVKNIRGDAFKIQGCKYFNIDNVVINRTTVNNGFIIVSSSHHINCNNIMVNDVAGYGFAVESSSYAITGNNININNARSRGFELYTVNNCTFSNVMTRDCFNNFLYASKNFKISNSVFSYSDNNGLDISSCSFFSITGCTMNYNSIEGAEFTSGVVNNNYSFSNCVFKNNAGKGMDIGADHNLTIINCLFNSNTNDGIECDALDSVIITGNIMWGDPFDDNIVGSNNITGTNHNIGMTTI